MQWCFMFSGKGGVTHNMIDDIHNHWKRAKLLGSNAWECQLLTWTIYASILRSHSTTYLEILETTFYFLFCLVSCQCTIVQDKTGGKVIYRNINILILYRGGIMIETAASNTTNVVKPLAPIYLGLCKMLLMV